MVTIYTLTYNEEVLIPFFISHYKKNFPNCKIIIYDNESTDRTVEIAKEMGCEIRTYLTGNKLSDTDYLKIKNNVWKESSTDWVIVCDCDELISLNQNELINEENNKTNIIKPIGYSIMNHNEDFKVDELSMGFRDYGFDKCVLFNKKFIEEINYGPGCHQCNPLPKNGESIKFNTNEYKLLHYKYLSPTYTVNRHKMFGDRLSEENKQRGWGIHYTFSSESIIKFYDDKKNELIKLL